MSLENIKNQYDLVVIGGGITGAGILREAVRAGLSTLLVEQKDFAWGTSSRSSKLVHGGLRYLKEGKFKLTWDSVHERIRLLKEAPGLVEPIGFLWPAYKGQSPGKTALGAGLWIYDLMGGKKQHASYSAQDFAKLVPQINTNGLTGGMGFADAQVDDARLVLRVIQEAVAAGGQAANYVKAKALIRNSNDELTGIVVEDAFDGTEKEIATRAAINATGFFAEKLQPSPVDGLHLRPLRGSHLMFPLWKIPIGQAVSFIHPRDNRPIFAIPWEGAVMVGTTDLDHAQNWNDEPRIAGEEAEYLLEGLKMMFPEAGISAADCIAAWSGVRPVLSSGDKDPSKESREHVVWTHKGLVTITGGKLTTFRLLALDALAAAAPFCTKGLCEPKDRRIFTPVPEKPEDFRGLELPAWRRLFGRYGLAAQELVKNAKREDLETIPGTNSLFAEIPFCAGNENIRCLADLLLRRVRLGFVLEKGGEKHLDRIQSLCQDALDWDADRWQRERQDYLALWKKAYAPLADSKSV
jgi:glycerol-3-phosphate dehydrogenase